MLLQLEQAPNENDLEITLLKDYFDLFVGKKITLLSKELNVSVSEIQASIDKIISLEPKPGTIFKQNIIEYIVPDIRITTELGNKLICIK